MHRKMKISTVGMILLLLITLAGWAEAVVPFKWTVPPAFTAGTPEDASAAAALLNTDAAALQEALRENDAVLLLVTSGGSTVQLTVSKDETNSFDFSKMGSKKLAILASSLAEASGEEASVVRLYTDSSAAAAEEPEPTAEPGTVRCTDWICLRPSEEGYPYTETWLTEQAGYELTVYVTWQTEEEKTVHAQEVQDFLYSLMILQEN